MVLENNEGQEIKKSLNHLTKLIFEKSCYYVVLCAYRIGMFSVGFVCMVLLNVSLKSSFGW